MSTDYLPSEQTKYPRWFLNLSDKFTNVYAALLGLESEAQGLQDDALMIEYLINQYKGEFETARTTVTSFANKMLTGGMDAPTAILSYPVTPEFTGAVVAPDIIGRTRGRVARIKAAGGYTREMGRDMGIVAESTEQEMTAPDLTIEALEGLKLRVKWLKGEADALELLLDFGSGYPKKGDRFSRTPFTFAVDLPDGVSAPIEARVKARYIEDDAPVGEFGPEYTVTIRS